MIKGAIGDITRRSRISLLVVLLLNAAWVTVLLAQQPPVAALHLNNGQPIVRGDGAFTVAAINKGRSGGFVEGRMLEKEGPPGRNSVRAGRASSDELLCECDLDRVYCLIEEVEAGLEREWVRRCLDRLTALQRQSVTLAYYDGYTYREVAERLSLPLGTVKTRMRDGLARLRECLGGAA